jgi:hypothetical protein
MVRDGDDITLKIVDRRIESTTKIFSQFLTLTAIYGRIKRKKKSSIRKQTKTHIRIYPHTMSS